MTRSFKVPVDTPSVTIDGKAVGALADTGTPSDLASSASRGDGTQAARSNHAHRTVVVYAASAPASTDSVWVDTTASAATTNASTATALQTARRINGVLFDGTSDITSPTVATYFKWGND